jgi:hypothetical protein
MVHSVYMTAEVTCWKNEKSEFDSSSQRPNRLWEPPTFTVNGHRVLFPERKLAGAWIWLLTSTYCSNQRSWSCIFTSPHALRTLRTRTSVRVPLPTVRKVRVCIQTVIQRWKRQVPTCRLKYVFTFMLPCIVIDFFLNNQSDALIIQIYSVIKLYMFRATSLPIIRSFLLYNWQW